MAYPILAPNSTWFAPTVSTVKRANITEIEIMDSYTPDSSVTVVNSWDASAAKDGSIMCYVIGTKLIIAGNGSGKIAMNVDSSYIFSDKNDSTFDMFEKVEMMTNIHLLACDDVVTLAYAFWNMSKITYLDLSSWNTEKLNDITMMVFSCSKLSSLNVSNWITEHITTMCAAFRFTRCLNEIVGFDTWTLPNLEVCWGCFDGALLTSLDLTKWNVSKVKNFNFMICGMPKLTHVDISNWDTAQAETMKGMFKSNPLLTRLDMPYLKLNNVTTTREMFYDCQSLSEINVSDWDVKSVNDMMGMFDNCFSLKNIDVSNWNTSSCTDMSFMFYSCSSLKEIDVSNWDVSKVTNFDHFAAHANLKRKGIENWKTTSATNMNALFHNCAEEELDLSGWDVSKNQFFCQMFENSPNLKRIKGLEKWNTSAGLGFDGMFERCSKLEEVDLSAFDTTKAKNGTKASTNGHTTATLSNMFLSCNNLKKVKVGPNFSINGNGSNTTAANKAILPTPSADYIEGADGNWYNFIGESFAPNGMKDKTAETYYASYDIVADMDVICKNGSLIDTAKAIREKNGATDHYVPAQFGAAIRALN